MKYVFTFVLKSKMYIFYIMNPVQSKHIIKSRLILKFVNRNTQK